MLTGDILNVIQDMTPVTPNAFGKRKKIGSKWADYYVASAVGSGLLPRQVNGFFYGALRHKDFDTMRELLREEPKDD